MNVQVLETSGGKVETQRQCLQNAPFLIFIDADVYITPQTIQGLCETMTSSPNVHVAYPPKTPLRPRSRSWIARAAYHYAKEEGALREEQSRQGR